MPKKYWKHFEFKRISGGSIPNYLAHTATNCVFGLSLTCYGFFGQTVVDRHSITIASLSFLAATFLLSPDLDLHYSTPTKNWGILRVIWRGYSKVFRHRGLSHSLFFSSFTKLIYIIGVSLLFLGVSKLVSGLLSGDSFYKAFDLSKDVILSISTEGLKHVTEHKVDMIAALSGIILNDWIHILADRLISFIRRAT